MALQHCTLRLSTGFGCARTAGPACLTALWIALGLINAKSLSVWQPEVATMSYNDLGQIVFDFFHHSLRWGYGPMGSNPIFIVFFKKYYNII